MAKKTEKSGKQQLAELDEPPADESVTATPPVTPSVAPAEPKYEDHAESIIAKGEPTTAPACCCGGEMPAVLTIAVVTPDSLTITLPLGELPAGGYLARHLEINGMTPQQQQGLRRLIEGAKSQQLRLANGRLVEHNADVIRYLLEQVPS